MTQSAQTRHDLELARFRAERQLPKAKEAAARAAYDLRQCQENLMGYENGFAGLIARFTGKREEKLEALNAQVRHAAARREECRRAVTDLEHTLKETEEALSALPGWEALKSPQWECRALARMLAELLPENYEALAEARKSLRGERRGEIMSQQAFQEFYAAADRTGEVCGVLVRRLRELGAMAQVPPYYRTPTAYTANAATAFHRLDRVNEAMDQCRELLSAVKRL